jgi:hypothetical protein
MTSREMPRLATSWPCSSSAIGLGFAIRVYFRSARSEIQIVPIEAGGLVLLRTEFGYPNFQCEPPA